MAENYISQGTYSDIQVLGSNSVQNVVVVQATATPSGVYFELAIPTISYNAGGEEAFVEPTAEGVNYLANHANVSGVVYTEDLDNNGLIQSYMLATITIPTPAGRTGPFTQQLQVPIGYLGTDADIRNAVVDPMIQTVVDRLTATASN